MINEKAKVLNVIGWFDIIGGIIGSFILGDMYGAGGTFNLGIAIIGIIGSIVSGITFLGFAEIINLMQIKVDNSEKVIKLLNSLNINTNDQLINDKIDDELPSL